MRRTCLSLLCAAALSVSFTASAQAAPETRGSVVTAARMLDVRSGRMLRNV